MGKPKKNFGEEWINVVYCASVLDLDNKETMSYTPKLYNDFNDKYKDEEGYIKYQHPMTFAVMLEDDSPRYHQTMNGPYSDGFFEAMHKEIETMEKMDPWEVVPRTNSEGHNVLNSIWAYKRNHFPDRRVRKLKAQFCVRGDQQEEGVDFFKVMRQ